jgi:hypothetical protein
LTIFPGGSDLVIIIRRKGVSYDYSLYICNLYTTFDEEVINSQESPKMEEFFKDFDWELDRFVEYRLPIKKPL